MYGAVTHAFLDKDGRPARVKQDFPELFECLTKLCAG